MLVKKTFAQQLPAFQEIPLSGRYERLLSTQLLPINALVLRNLCFLVKLQEFQLGSFLNSLARTHAMSNNKFYLLVTSYILNTE